MSKRVSPLLKFFGRVVRETFLSKKVSPTRVLHPGKGFVKVKIFTYQKGNLYIFIAKHWLHEVAQLQIQDLSSLYKDGNVFVVSKINVKSGWEHVGVELIERLRKIVGAGYVRAKLRADNYNAYLLLRNLGFVEVDNLICFRLDLHNFHQIPVKPQQFIYPLSGLSLAAFTNIHNQLFSEALTEEGALHLLSGNFQGTSFYIQKDTTVISYILSKVIGRRLYIEELGTHDKFRRRGFAKMLVRYTLAKAASLALLDAYAHVNSKNYIAIALFLRLGFEPDHVILHLQLPLSKMASVCKEF